MPEAHTFEQPLFNLEASAAHSGVAKPAGKRGSRTARKAAPRHRDTPNLKFDGALTTALGEALAAGQIKQTKDQLAASVLPDVIHALEAHPGASMKLVLQVLKDLDPKNDGPSFRKALNRVLLEEEWRHPVIALTVKKRRPRGEPRPTERDSSPSAPAERKGTQQPQSSSLEEQVRSLRAPGF